MLKPPVELIKFCLVGVLNTLVDFAVFTLLSFWHVPLLAAQSLSYSCGLLNSFLLNRTWTFRGSGQSPGQFIKFVTINLCTLSVTYGLLVWFHYQLAWPVLSSKLAATGIALAINFLGSRLWVFRPSILINRSGSGIK